MLTSPRSRLGGEDVARRKLVDRDARSRPCVVVFTCLLASLFAFSVHYTPARAVPITVNLRVEGSSQTLFEGPVSSEPIVASPGITTKSSGGAHPCDVKDNGSNGGFGSAAATPTAALFKVASAQGLAFDATWSSGFNDFLVTQVGGDVNGGAPEFPSWGYAVNYTTAGVGGCQFQLAPGSNVLWAYNYFNLTHLLSLAGSTTANVGTGFTVHVADGQTGEPISGAAIGEVLSGAMTPIPSSSVTDSSGNATVSIGHAGAVTLKATRAGSVRSNGLVVCVHAGNDGSCGTVSPAGAVSPPHPASMMSTSVMSNSRPATAEVAKVLGLSNGRIYPRRSAPRVLRGIVLLSGDATLGQVRIRLERRYRNRCFAFSGSTERFVHKRRCGQASFFSVGSGESFSYLLPAPLPPGRYVYDVQARDAAGHLSALQNGVSHVVFRVS